MKRYVVVEKKIGETPLSAIHAWKKQNPAEDVPASYAGRLDPMASGKLLVLLGEECKKQKVYTGLDKEYEVEVLLGVGSDTGDILGLCEYAETRSDLAARSDLERVLRNEEGSHMRKYPAFSSKTLRGKPLFLHTLEGTLKDEEIPEHIEELYRVQLEHIETIPVPDLQKKISELLAKAPKTLEPSKALGEDFRIDAVRESWENVFARAGARAFTVVRLRVVCASGAYMRSLAPRIGSALGTQALALSIHRTKIGKYVPLGRFGFWLRQY
jgi:tRNA pseudouridine(55) synthase